MLQLAEARTGHHTPVWVLGASICLGGSTLTALGLVLQKKSHTKQEAREAEEASAMARQIREELPEEVGEDEASEKTSSGTVPSVAKANANHEGNAYQVGVSHCAEPLQPARTPLPAWRKMYWCQPLWLLGFSLYLGAQLINMVSMAMTPQVVLSCLGSWTLVCNTLFAVCCLGERLRFFQGLAVVFLIVSTALVLYTAPRPSEDQSKPITIKDVQHRLLSVDFGTLSAVAIILVAMAVIVIHRVNRTRRLPQRIFQTSLSFEVVVEEEENRYQALLPPAWAFLGAVCAGYTACFFKCIAELVAGESKAPWKLLASPWTYLLLVLGFTCAPLELHCLNRALQTGAAVSVVPMYLAMGMLCQLLTGGVFFQEFDAFHSTRDLVYFILSVLFALCSVVGMARAQALPEATEEAEGEIALTTVVVALGGSHTSEGLAESLRPADVSAAAEEVRVGSWEAATTLASPRLVGQVSMSGFGGAIECLDQVRNTAVKRSLSPVPARGSRPSMRHTSLELGTIASSSEQSVVRSQTI